ncbi:MAG TPA: signal peptidase II [Candidatus Limiplasma sp.]|nr:signal peptidase II [Candidatus Limiplasma sp.]HPS80277.1 signal peptidase II [Candidatus Limiplasma sp.]
MLVWIMAATVFVLDRAAKIFSLANLPGGAHTVLLPGVLELRLMHNQGLALGLLSGYTLLNLILPVVVVIVGWLALRRYRTTRFTRAAVGLVIGGFLGNLFDRLSMGFVTDMIYFPWMPWYICNLADIAICVGVALLAFSLLFRARDWQLKTEAKADEPHHPDSAR